MSRFDPDEEIGIVLRAIEDCLNPSSGMAHLPDVVAICVVSGFTRPNAYNVIDRHNNQCWRRIGSSIGFIQKGKYE